MDLSSRIEQLTKTYKVPFLIGDGTYDSLADPSAFSIRMVDRVAVKGKQRDVTLYEVIDADVPHRREAKESTRKLLSEALYSYYGRDFSTAYVTLLKAMAMDPEDRVLSILAKRSDEYRDAPPDEDWQGFETMHRK